MDSKQVINQRQLSWLAASMITSGGIFTLQNVLVRISQMDAWFSYVISIFYIFTIAAFFGYLAKVFPRKNIFDIVTLVLGRWAGSVLNLLVLFHFWQVVKQDLSSVSKFSSTLLLHNTPLEILILMPCLLLIYFGKSSLEIVARVNDLFYPLFAIATLSMPFLLSNEFDLKLVTPVLTMPLHHLASSNILALGSAGDIFAFGAFLHMLYNADHIRSAIRHGTLFGVLLFTIYIFMVLTVFGPRMPANFIYPAYNLIQMIHVTDFLDRLDIVLLTIWMPTLALKTITVYVAMLIGISSMLKQPNYPVFNKQTALFLTLTTFLSYHSTTELLSFANFSMPVIVLAYQPLYMCILLVAVMVYKRKHAAQPPPDESQSPSSQAVGSPTQPMAKVSVRLSYSHWRWGGNALMLLSVLCILIGCAFSKYMPRVGILCGFTFGCCLILTAMTTYMEVSKLQQVEAGK